MSERVLRSVRTFALVVLIGGEVYIVFNAVINGFWNWLFRPRTPEWWGAAGQWAGAIGTIAAVVVALGIAIRDGRRGRAEAGARAERERREHVSHLSAWPVSHRADDQLQFPMKLLNTSNEPFFNVVVFPVFIQGAAPRTGEEWLSDDEPEYGNQRCAVIAALPPGRWEIVMNVDTGIMQGRAGVEISGSDRHGVHWIRRATGTVDEIPVDPISYYGIERPIDYRSPSGD
ncbi:hypothetical protein [Amycolatopsis sp. NPDC049159]|uniref:hypothetical protein n=1 Tax=unclassified Amycolatopsis TaxID=2618356 RepID=UPI0033C31C49